VNNIIQREQELANIAFEFINRPKFKKYITRITPNNINFIAFCFDRSKGGVYMVGFEHKPFFDGSCWKVEWGPDLYTIDLPDSVWSKFLKSYIRIENSLVVIRKDMELDISNVIEHMVLENKQKNDTH